MCTLTLSVGDERPSFCVCVSLSPPEVLRERGLCVGRGGREEEGVGEGVWKRGEGVGCAKEGEVNAEEGVRIARKISTRAGLESTV